MAIKITPSTEAILDVLQEGRATPGYLQEQTGLSRNTVQNQLRSLLSGDCVQYVHEPTGLYELVDDPRVGDGNGI
ncbi:hypothetical protein C497_03635 [Halalkalicoccus jeotgali B3]|uniref:Helix-turn-helix type 11 domain-containing protein n=1 Tax=Halalkalicoccus jeotgali (strain DSM 18796 / CECT 7217 / JCM 14584 / KCTC 4019 / B3) TaxID=795797 RepID=L9VT54_HALJB|nr:hypothetical protein C497_03635 [Halalkalicoccus jeotgali B3]